MTQTIAKTTSHRGLNTPQIRAVADLLDGLPITQVAQRAGVHRNTVTTWLKHQTFQDALREARERIRLELFSLKTQVQRQILSGGLPQCQCPHCRKKTVSLCEHCHGTLLIPDFRTQALIANELERSEARLEQAAAQRVRPPTRHVRVVFNDDQTP